MTEEHEISALLLRLVAEVLEPVFDGKGVTVCYHYFHSADVEVFKIPERTCEITVSADTDNRFVAAVLREPYCLAARTVAAVDYDLGVSSEALDGFLDAF